MHHQNRLGLHVQRDSIGGAGQFSALGGEHQLMNPRSISGITIVGACFNGGLAVHTDLIGQVSIRSALGKNLCQVQGIAAALLHRGSGGLVPHQHRSRRVRRHGDGHGISLALFAVGHGDGQDIVLAGEHVIETPISRLSKVFLILPIQLALDHRVFVRFCQADR